MNTFERALRAKFHRDEDTRIDEIADKEALRDQAQREIADERLQSEERTITSYPDNT